MDTALSNRPRRLRRAAPLVAGITLSAAGCAGTLADPGEFETTGGNNSSTPTASNSSSSTSSGTSASGCVDPTSTMGLFTVTCGVSICHSPQGEASAEGLDLISPGLLGRLVNQASMEVPTDFLISTANPSQSFLLLKLQPNPPGGLAQMPYLEPALTAPQIQCLTQWVTEQAETYEGGAGAMDEAGANGASSSNTSSSSETTSSTPLGSSTSSSSSASTSSGGGGGGGAGDAGGGGAAVSFMTEVYPIISANCTAHHSGATPSGGLDMSTEAKAFTNLTTGTSTEAGCTEKYVGATATASLL
jgi:hypothetical protein